MIELIKNTLIRILEIIEIDPGIYIVDDDGIKILGTKSNIYNNLEKIFSIISTIDLGIVWTVKHLTEVDDGMYVAHPKISIEHVDIFKFSEIALLDDEDLSLLIKMKWGVS